MGFARNQLRRRERAGYLVAFTLVELVMTLAIVAVMAAIAIPHYGRSLTRYQADVAARRIAADLALARGNARALSITQTVDFSTRANGYTLSGMSDPDHPASSYVVDLSQPPCKSTVTSVAFGSGSLSSRKISFDRFGAPSAGGTVVVRSGDYQKTINVDATTGMATIQ